MFDLPVLNASFGALHFGEARLGHVGRTRRLVLAADALIRHPGGTLPQKFHEPAPLDGFYRLANRPEVTHQAVLDPHRRRTLRLIRATTDPILLIHDTTELDYTSITSLAGLGQIGNGRGRGYECHNTLAVHAPSRTVIGLAGQILHRRDRAPEGETRRALRDRPSRESRLWRRGSEAIGPAPAGATWIDVCDRGADVFEYIEYKHKAGDPFVVRSTHDRLCMAPDGEGGWRRCKLHAHARRLEPLGARYVATPGRTGPAPRRARVTIAAGPVELLAPKQPRGDHGGDPVPLNLVVVREVEPPAGAVPLEWILLTALPAGGLAEAATAADWYGCRPIVEELHKAMKTGCGIEALQFTTEAALQPAIALLTVVAVFLLQVRDAARDPGTAGRPATEYVPAAYAAVLCAWRHGEARAGWTIGEFYYALGRLGGHQNRRSDPPPGWLVLSRGWALLRAMVQGVEAMGRCRDPAGAPPGGGPPAESGPDSSLP